MPKARFPNDDPRRPAALALDGVAVGTMRSGLRQSQLLRSHTYTMPSESAVYSRSFSGSVTMARARPGCSVFSLRVRACARMFFSAYSRRLAVRVLRGEAQRVELVLICQAECRKTNTALLKNKNV